MRFRNGQWIDEHGFVIQDMTPEETSRAKQRREIATGVLSGICATNPSSRYSYQQMAAEAVSLADALLAQLAK